MEENQATRNTSCDFWPLQNYNKQNYVFINLAHKTVKLMIGLNQINLSSLEHALLIEWSTFHNNACLIQCNYTQSDCD